MGTALVVSVDPAASQHIAICWQPPVDSLASMSQRRVIIADDRRLFVAGLECLTMYKDPDLAPKAVRACACVLKHCAASELLEAVRLAIERKSYIAPLIAGMIYSLAKPSRDGDSDRQLTCRQREVLRLPAEGNSMKEIAATLNLTVRTVAFHKYRMMQLLNIKSSAGLVRFAVLQHIV